MTKQTLYIKPPTYKKRKNYNRGISTCAKEHLQKIMSRSPFSSKVDVIFMTGQQQTWLRLILWTKLVKLNVLMRKALYKKFYGTIH